MSATKYKQYFLQMIEQNQALFDDFTRAHKLFELDKEKYQVEFHRLGQKVVDVVRDWDRRLCSAMGRGAFSQYSQQLSEKFYGEVQKMFPLFYSIGVKST